MAKKIDELMSQMKEKWDGIKTIRDLVVEEKRDFTAEERGKVEKALDETRAIELQIDEERKNQSLMDQIESLGKGLENQQHQTQSAKTPGWKSIGQQFLESPEFQSWLKSVAPGGLIPDSRKGLISPPVEVKGLLSPMRQKTVITGASDTSAGAFIVPDDTGIYESLGRYPLTLRQLIDVRTTTSDAVEFVRQTTQVTQATPVAEANVTDFTGATGQVSGEKPEGMTTFERVQELVKTIAVWIPATKRALSDAGQLRGLLDSELRADVNEELEDQLLNGDGIDENFTGLANTANVLIQPFDTNILITARKAITNLLINGKQIPTAYLFNPQDWETVDLLRDLTGQFLRGSPFLTGPTTLWGVPVAQSFFQTQGSGWLGNWRKMVLWDREQATISASDSHADFFIRNLVAILCELRAALGVIRPTAFVEIDLTSGS
jgi:HK97 family phage major capsid protein